MARGTPPGEERAACLDRHWIINKRVLGFFFLILMLRD
jgi:hypothetical protein